MSSSGAADRETDARITSAMLSDDSLTVTFADGRVLSVPLWWFPRLLGATPAQRRNWRLIGKGIGIHWPDIDEDLSARGLLAGTRARDAIQPRGGRRA